MRWRGRSGKCSCALRKRIHFRGESKESQLRSSNPNPRVYMLSCKLLGAQGQILLDALHLPDVVRAIEEVLNHGVGHASCSSSCGLVSGQTE